ncbi:iron-siderophore ABC transporter substrate-binding protein [Deinococcus humi]|uniref:Iron complex transport system substrate-binding protein n=1 Tax=Deinococcus humi TaxID=662880 RepID=A0A7W8NER0_9DEIO|nr:iron-siderophore ABC transporter substrate-binding protein [Deinococcus humi]MBB5363586.1 iron complex transport system substrate-binding protein [Deinococcus humi]GGO30144.1 Fe(3+)-citrate-binding protein YfmC [Deinococcus humi]
MQKRVWYSAFLLCGLTQAAATTYPVTLTHEAGTTTVQKRPLRVVALGPHALDLLLSLGVQPVGYGEASTYIKTPAFGSPIRDIKYLGSRITSSPVNVGDRFSPSLEILATLKPDLIIGENYALPVYNQLSRIAPTLLFKGIDRNEWQKTLPALARALDKEKVYSSILSKYNKSVQTTKSQLSSTIKNKRVLVIWTGGGPEKNTFTISDSNDWTGGLLKDLGFNVIDGDKRDAAVSIEGLSAVDPDMVIVLASGTNTPTRAKFDWNSSPLTSGLRASKANQIYYFDYHLFRRIRGPIAAQLIERQLVKEMTK